MAKVIVVGAGIMGLAAAYQVLQDGHQVEVLEAADVPGGMASHFDLGGYSTEKFYHFICKTDKPTFELLRELGIEQKLHWVPTSMGFYSNGKLNQWGDPISLLKMPAMTLWQKFRYAIFAFVSVRKNSWPAIETQTAHEWITRWCGEDLYNRFWRSLFRYKFYEYAENISALWIWTRIRRIGRSRKSLLQEELGYLDGGSEALVKALTSAVEMQGGVIRLSSPSQTILTKDGRVVGVRTPEGDVYADDVISTAPTPYVSAMVPDLPEDWKQKYDAIKNIGVICVVFKLARSVSPHFWVNIADARFGIPGVIEFSNLRPAGESHIVYVPYYMPTTNEKFQWADEDLVTEAFACLQMLNPALSFKDLETTKVARLRYGQPICEPGFAAKIPPVQTPIQGLQIADTCFYYPEDRGVAESIRLGRDMARNIQRSTGAEQTEHPPEPGQSDSSLSKSGK